MMRRDVFQAIADPTRREIMALLASQPLNLNALADNFNISRPAVSQQIKILTECGLVAIRQQGRERYCEAKFDGLQEIADWVEQYRKFWSSKFEALDDLLENMKAESKTNKKKK
jgi:DNA-binding transcriptional ArsR family regulator